MTATVQFAWILGFALTLVSLAYTVRHFRVARAMSYIERMNRPDMVRIRQVVNVWIESPATDREKLDAIERDPELQVCVKIFMDIVTELGIAYRYRAVSRDLVREIWYPFIPSYWQKLQFYAYACQLKGIRTGYWFRFLAEEIGGHMGRREKILAQRYALPDHYYSPERRDHVPLGTLRADCGPPSTSDPASG